MPRSGNGHPHSPGRLATQDTHRTVAFVELLKHTNEPLGLALEGKLSKVGMQNSEKCVVVPFISHKKCIYVHMKAVISLSAPLPHTLSPPLSLSLPPSLSPSLSCIAGGTDRDVPVHVGALRPGGVAEKYVLVILIHG